MRELYFWARGHVFRRLKVPIIIFLSILIAYGSVSNNLPQQSSVSSAAAPDVQNNIPAPVDTIRNTTKPLNIVPLDFVPPGAELQSPAAISAKMVKHPSAATIAETSVKAKPQVSVPVLPLAFEVNNGQSDPTVRFLAHNKGDALFFTANEIVLAIPNFSLVPTQTVSADGSNLQAHQVISSTGVPAIVHLHFIGSAATPDIQPVDQLPGVTNYFRGSDPQKWRTNVKTYNGINYHQLYPGIDLGYNGASGDLKGTYSVAPGVDPTLINWRYDGANSVQVDASGNLIVTISPSTGSTGQQQPAIVTEHAPVAWQETNGQKTVIPTSYHIRSDGSVGFTLGNYDHNQTLLIDPLLTFSTYLSGSTGATPSNIAVDSSGNIYIVGTTTSTDFPTQGSLQGSNAGGSDVFISKISADGSVLIYSTYLGGTGNDTGNAIALDSSGNAYVTGSTQSTDFPVTAGVVQGTLGASATNNVFVSKINSSGSSLVYSTYLGGTAKDQGKAIIVDGSGNAYVTGDSTSSDYPTVNAYQSAKSSNDFGQCGGGGVCTDAILTELNPTATSLVFSTYLGGGGGDSGNGIALDSSGNIFLVGYTWSTNFPTLNPIQGYSGSIVGGCGGRRCEDVFVTKFNSSGSALTYSTYIGGNNYDFAYAVAIDSSGSAYVSGTTNSTNYPLTSGALQGSGTGVGTFVTKLNAAGSALVYSAEIPGTGGVSSGSGNSMALDSSGNVYITGSGVSLPITPVKPIQAQCGDPNCQDVYIGELNSTGSALLFSSYLGGSGIDTGIGIARDSNGNIDITGSTSSIDFPTKNSLYISATTSINSGNPAGFVAQINLVDPPLPFDLNPAGEPCPCKNPQPQAASVNTRTGNRSTGATDLSVPGQGAGMIWTREYNSQATSYITNTGSLSYGWINPFSTNLITPTMQGGEVGKIIIVTGAGSKYRFTILQSGAFSPDPGTRSTLVKAGGVYTQTLPGQQMITFNSNGQATALIDAQNNRDNLNYTGSVVTSITDAANPGRYLNLTYDVSNTHIIKVSDPFNRSVQYTYDGTTGDLTGVTDVMNHTMNYHYQGHLLTEIDDNLGEAVEHTTYDSYTPTGKAISQTMVNGEQIQYNYLTSSTIITNTANDGKQDILNLSFDTSNTLTNTVINGVNADQSSFDPYYNSSASVDANGASMTANFTSMGLPLNETNSLTQTISASYDTYNRPVTTTDLLGLQTALKYDANNNVISQTTGITTSFPLGFTTIYTYNVRYAGKNLLEDMQGSDGVVTHNEYNTTGQMITTTVGYNTSLAKVSTFGYDSLGRVMTTTIGVGTPLQRMDVYIYNADDTLAQKTENYKTGVYNPSYPDQDIITKNGYDALHRLIWTRDVLGHYNLYHFNASDRHDWNVSNPIPLTFDGSGNPIIPSTPPTYSPAQPDANVAKFFGYDSLGHTILITETGILTGTFNTATMQFSASTTRVTKTDYDSLSRPITITMNYNSSLPANADTNLQKVFRYDNAGNKIWERDTLGHWTKIDYDLLNRPITMTVNYENGNPLTVDAGNQSWTDGTDTDIISVARYTPDGQISQSINNYVTGQFSVSAPITDVVTLYGYDAEGRTITTTLAYDPSQSTHTDTNRNSVAAYDPITAQLIGQQDALGIWSHIDYDALGNPITVTQNCRNGSGTPVSSGCTAFNANIPDKNIPSTTHYDALNRTFESVDALGHVTHTNFDGMGRPISNIDNYVFNGPTTAITNVTTLNSYDGLGRTLVITDPIGAVTNYSYNNLSLASVVTDTMGHVTTMGYDGSGKLRWTKRQDGVFTVYKVDGMGRTVTTIQNYVNGIAGSLTDQDVISQVVYDAGGRKLQSIDPSGLVTSFAYDNRGILTTLTQNVQTTCTLSPCNVVTSFKYDRSGARISTTDARSNTTKFTYDAAGRELSITDPLTRTTSWSYDKLGNKTKRTDPRGSSYNLNFAYDGLYRLFQTTSTKLYTITLQYDALGHQLAMTDTTGTTSFTNDPLGRITQIVAPNTGAINYWYNARGDRTQIAYPDNTTLQYNYYNDGQLNNVISNTTTLASYTYDIAGRLSQLNRSNGANTLYGYDHINHTNMISSTVSGIQRSAFSYKRDLLGQPTLVTETLGAQTRVITNTYDGLLRLTNSNESPGNNYNYTYDLVGNRTQLKVNNVISQTRSYDTANQISGTGWTYDAAGNLTNDTVATYTYDSLNRMTKYVKGATTVNYNYNGMGALASTVNGSTTARFTEDLVGSSQILQISGTTTTDLVYGLERLTSITAGTKTWYLSDSLGSVRQTLNDSGTALNTQNYDPWGNGESGSAGSTFGYTGQLLDSASGLLDLRARWYQPSNARFMARDSWGGNASQPITMNGYTYANDDPALYNDPSGHDAEQEVVTPPIFRTCLKSTGNLNACGRASLSQTSTAAQAIMQQVFSKLNGAGIISGVASFAMGVASTLCLNTTFPSFVIATIGPIIGSALGNKQAQNTLNSFQGAWNQICQISNAASSVLSWLHIGFVLNQVLYDAGKLVANLILMGIGVITAVGGVGGAGAICTAGLAAGPGDIVICGGGGGLVITGAGAIGCYLVVFNFIDAIINIQMMASDIIGGGSNPGNKGTSGSGNQNVGTLGQAKAQYGSQIQKAKAIKQTVNDTPAGESTVGKTESGKEFSSNKADDAITAEADQQAKAYGIQGWTSTYGKHAEIQALYGDPESRILAVSNPNMCGTCREFYKAWVDNHPEEGARFVMDQNQLHIFQPNGTTIDIIKSLLP